MSADRRFVGIVTLAFILRVAGIHFGLPYAYHQDEPIVVNHAMAIGVQGWNTGVYLPPQFASYFLFLVYVAYFLVGHLSGYLSGTAAFALTFLKDPTLFYLLGRFFLGVMFGTASVALLYLLCQRYFSERIAERAALFLAVAPMAVAHSHYIYMDSALLFFMVLLFYRLLAWIKNPSFENQLWLGAVFGLCVSVKYTAVYFFPTLIIAVFLPAPKNVGLLNKIKTLLVIGAVSIAAYAAVSPFSFLDWANFMEQVAYQSQARGYVGWQHHLLYSLGNGTGLLFLILTVLGTIHLWRVQQRAALLLGVAFLTYYLVNIYFSQPFLRYMIPLLPVICIFAAHALEGKFSTLLLFMAAAEMLIVSVCFDGLLFTKDTRTQCLEWFARNVSEKSVVVVDNHFFSPPLNRTKEQVDQKIKELSGRGERGARKKRAELLLTALEGKRTYTLYTLMGKDQSTDSVFLFHGPFVRPDIDEMDRIHAQYLVLNYSDPEADIQVWAASLGPRVELVASFSPFRDPSQKRTFDKFGTTGPPDSRRDLFSRTRLGPYLEIYRIKS